MRPIIVWFRRDLRIDDNEALLHASRSGAPVIPLFVFDSHLIHRLPSDGAVFDFQAESLNELRKNIRRLGGNLIVRSGEVLRTHRQVIAEMKPAALYFNRDYEPFAMERDRAVTKLYLSNDIEVKTFKDVVMHEPNEVLTAEGSPYVVFTPFARKWRELDHTEPLAAPRPIMTPGIEAGHIMTAAMLKKATFIPEPTVKGGESEAKKRWKKFLTDGIAQYAAGRNSPALRGTSRMSPYLRFGCISVRRMVYDCRKLQSSLKSRRSQIRTSIDKFVDELIWREFYQSVLFHFPRLLQENYRQMFNRMPWRFDERLFNAWKEGRTGFPLVDAGMRELNTTGWMHNRVRMVVASFLTKDLLHDWRLGEKYFEEKLIDIETASNNGGWQWAASTGVDPRPLRIFNPRLQSERYDPDGTYIRTYVHELRTVPTRFIHSPSEMPHAMQVDCGVIIGKHYPSPIIHHSDASTRFKTAFMSMKK